MSEYEGPYEGWSNWYTWNVVLWIDNEEPRYKRKVALQKQFIGQQITAGRVEAFCRHEFPMGTKDMSGKGARTVMDKVNYSEIANSWNEEIKELANYI